MHFLAFIHQPASTNSIHLQSNTTPHSQYLWWDLHLESSRESVVGLFVEAVYELGPLKMSAKDPIWLSLRRPDLTSWGCLEMTSRGRPNLMLKRRPWETDLGRPQGSSQDVPWRNFKAHLRGDVGSSLGYL